MGLIKIIDSALSTPPIKPGNTKNLVRDVQSVKVTIVKHVPVHYSMCRLIQKTICLT